MAAPAKWANTHLTQVKPEASYAAETAALPTVDTSYTLHTRDEPTISPDDLFNGDLEGEGSPGGSARPFIAPTGPWAEFVLPAYFRSPTTTYSSTVYPDLFRALRGHGLSLAFSAGTLTLAPQRTAHTSIAVDAYLHGELEHLYGCHLNRIECKFAHGRVPEWLLTGRGIRSVIPTDVAVPSLGYQVYSRNAAKFVNTTAFQLTVGPNTTTLGVAEGTWSSERPIEPRAYSAETGDSGLRHPGWVLGNEVATFEGVIEATARTITTPFASGANMDPTRIFRDGSLAIACALQAGTMTAQHGFKIATATASLMSDVKRQKSGAIPRWEISLRMNASTDVAADAYAITAT